LCYGSAPPPEQAADTHLSCSQASTHAPLQRTQTGAGAGAAQQRQTPPAGRRRPAPSRRPAQARAATHLAAPQRPGPIGLHRSDQIIEELISGSASWDAARPAAPGCLRALPWKLAPLGPPAFPCTLCLAPLRYHLRQVERRGSQGQVGAGAWAGVRGLSGGGSWRSMRRQAGKQNAQRPGADATVQGQGQRAPPGHTG
jgi:hypothetical protein